MSILQIQEEVSKYYHVPLKDLKGKKRVKTIVVPRQISMYLAREMTDNSLQKLVPNLAKDHTTVIHAHEKIQQLLEKIQRFKKKSVKLKFIELLGCGKLNKRTKLSTTYAQVDNLVKSMLF